MTCAPSPCLQAGTLPLHKEPTDIDLLVEEVVRSLTGAGATGVTVTAEVPADLPILDVDPVRIEEVLANLVANGVGTAVGRHGHGPGRGRRRSLCAARRRHGVASTRDLLPHIFERFAKGAGSTGSESRARHRAPSRGRSRRRADGRSHGECRYDVPGQPAPLRFWCGDAPDVT